MHIGKQLRVIIVEPETMDRIEEQAVAVEVDDTVTIDMSDMTSEVAAPVQIA